MNRKRETEIVPLIYFHAPGIPRPVTGGGAGGARAPQNFWKLKNITINEPKKKNNVQQSVLNADAEKAFYNFTTFNKIRHLLSCKTSLNNKTVLISPTE